MSSANTEELRRKLCVVCDEPADVTVRDRYRDIRVGVCRDHHEEAFGE
jgi:hypothetical protein